MFGTSIAISVIIIIIPFVVLGYLYSLYVGVIKSANSAREALSGIDVQLKKRSDLIPNILTIAQKFMEHERALFGEITSLRTQAQNAAPGSKEKFQLEGELNTKLNQLMVQVENYPQLKSDATMVQAMQTYNEVEEHISAARRFYNSALTELRNATTIFPSSIFKANAGETLEYDFFRTDETSRQPVSANNYLK